VKLVTHLLLMPRIRMTGAMPSLLHIPSWSTRGQHIYSILDLTFLSFFSISLPSSEVNLPNNSVIIKCKGYTIFHEGKEISPSATAYKPSRLVSSSWVLEVPSSPWSTYVSSACMSVFYNSLGMRVSFILRLM
jgi:hypothetical protein